MILADTDVLSALAKVERLHLLFTIYAPEGIYITPSVLAELAKSQQQGLAFAQAIFIELTALRIQVIGLNGVEQQLAESLPNPYGAGERETIAVAQMRRGTVVSNESRVAHWCRQHQIPCDSLPIILRALWHNSIMSQEQVRDLITDLQQKDRMGFSKTTLSAIFRPEE